MTAGEIRKQHAELRRLLHAEIRQRRTRMRRGISFIPCACCGKNVIRWFEMHEALIARKPVALAQQHLIFVKENVVQLCVPCHRKYQDTAHLLEKSLDYLIETEGAFEVAAWYIRVAPQIGFSTGRVPEDGDWKGYLETIFLR
jgi:hypothetical protein